MQKQEYLYKDPNNVANLNNVRLKDKYCEVTIKIGGTEIRTHKVILAANLKCFKMMLSSDSFRESQGDVNKISTNIFYRKNPELLVAGEFTLTDGNALNLLELANYLSEDDIKEACVEFLEKHLKAEEACRAYKLASTIKCLSLKNAAKAKIIENFGECSESADFLDFDSDSLADLLLNAIAQSIQVQKMLFEGIMRWVWHNAKDRKVFLEDLLKFIDLSKLSFTGCIRYLHQRLYHWEDHFGHTEELISYYRANKIVRKEREHEQILMVISEVGSFQFYNFIEKEWSSRQQIPNAAFENSSSAVLNDKLYHIGYVFGEKYLQAFDPSSKQDTRLHSSSSILTCTRLCACKRFIYICGGVKEDGSRSHQFLKYDPQTNSLETLTPMRHARSSPAVIFYRDCVYVVGGFDGISSLEWVEKFDPVRNEWTALASMCKGRCGHAVAILNGKLYVCGGHSDGKDETSVEMYDLATNSWHLLASMNKARCNFLMVAHKGKLLAIGGVGQETVEAYDPTKDQWQMNDEMSLGLQNDCYVGGLFSSSSMITTE